MAITPQYQAYLNSPEWKSKRLKVLFRAKFKCERCGKNQATQIHHLTYKRIYQEELTDLQAVCAKCHMKIHDIKEKKRIRLFKGIGKLYRKLAG